ncbi:MAG: Rab family GTPase [Promethearchaeota archaeon]
MEGTISLKLVLLGEANVGKTSIINSYLGKEFPDQYLPTIGNYTAKKEYNIKEKDIIVNVTVWDAGGQRSFNPFSRTLYTNIDCALLVFDLTKPKETFLNLKKEFLENINQYSEDVVSVLVGNKIDLLTSNEKLIITLKELMSKRDHIYLTSAKTGIGIIQCFELLIYTFLRKSELMDPDLVPSNTSKAFLKLIGKNDEELKEQLWNLSNIDTVLEKVKIKPKVKKETEDEKEIKELKYYDFLIQQLEKNESQKNEVMDQFLINLTELGKTINHIQKSHSKSAENLVESLKDLFITTKKDFESNIELISKLNIEEFELVKIISKVKEEQLAQL